MLENPTHVEAFLILLLPFYPFCSLWPVLHHSRCTSLMHSEQGDEIKQNNEKLPLCSLTILRARPWLKSRKIATTNLILTLALVFPKNNENCSLFDSRNCLAASHSAGVLATISLLLRSDCLLVSYHGLHRGTSL